MKIQLERRGSGAPSIRVGFRVPVLSSLGSLRYFSKMKINADTRQWKLRPLESQEFPSSGLIVFFKYTWVEDQPTAPLPESED